MNLDDLLGAAAPTEAQLRRETERIRTRVLDGLERGTPDRSRRSRTRRGIAGLLGVLVVSGGGVAYAHGSLPLIQNTDESSAIGDFMVGKAATEVVPTSGTRPTLDDVYQGLRSRHGRSGKSNQISKAQPPAHLVERCRASFTADSSCGVVLAMDDGALKPGKYSDEELAAAVARAGYEWSADS